ncbi:MAG: hypothetical protein OSB00_00470, partial [Sphingomonas bacterium]|nr:hypothetical protein [Sphingomonas bacterium]
MVVATMIVAGFVRRSSSPFGRKAATVRAAPIHGNRGVLDLKAINKLPLDGLYDRARIRTFGETDVHGCKGP